ncbi:hypothetical protein TanjilG_31997 [Lupinus angustifolius]|uniref:Uncharacterized protein n=1 Tax=Lupinus angustifolius TaxID=3871 RepID=A0A1J7I179_LUPAN|nr:hypothetical protein TanjilG_31997 [Lupinus angustifolius]
MENRLLDYLISYILIQRNTNHAQPIVNDLRFMFAVKENIVINWPDEILKVMYSVSTSQSRLLPYSIFISRVIDYLHIDVLDIIVLDCSEKDHLIGESLIHKMGIYKYGNTWQYQEDFNNANLDPSGEYDQDDNQEPFATTQGEYSGHAS